MRKFFKTILILLQIVIACLLVGTGAFFWRLHKGPIDIDAYIPYLVQAASNDRNKITVEKAQMRWGGIWHPVDFALKDLKVFNDKKQLLLSIPQTNFSISLFALLQGSLAPRTMAIYRPYVHLIIDASGEVKEASDSPEESVSMKTIVDLMRSERHLVEFSLIKAKIKITDNMHQAEWLIPRADVTYSRRFKKKHLKGMLKVAMNKGEALVVNLNGKWKRHRKMTLNVDIDNLDLTASLAAQKYAYLQNFTTPVDINATMKLNAAPLFSRRLSLTDLPKVVEKIDFNIVGKEGVINLPAPVIARYNLSTFKINGTLSDALNNCHISSFEMTTQTGGKAWGNFSVTGIGDALHAKSWEKIQSVLNAQGQNIEMDMLPDYWPASIGPDVHGWVKANLSKGLINSADFKLHFIGLKEGGVDADMVDGNVYADGVRVHYLDGMPAIDDVSGHVRLTRSVITITVAHGHTDSVKIANGGTFAMSGLDAPVTTADLNTDLSGNVRDVLAILDAPALELGKSMGISPDKTGGTASGNLQISFPMGDAFQSVDQLKIKASAKVTNADVDDIVLGMGVQDAILTAELQNKDLTLSGTSLFYSATAKFSIMKTFDSKKDILTDIKFHTDLNERARKALGYPMTTAPALGGTFPADLQLIQKNDGTGFLEIKADLTPADIDMREIGWVKPAKKAADFLFEMDMRNNKPTVIKTMRATDANGTLISGTVDFTDGLPSALTLSPIKTGRTQAAVNMQFLPDNSVSIDLNAKEIDISGLIAKGPSVNSKDHTETASDKKAGKDIVLKAKIDKAWLSKDGFAENNSFSARYDNGWKRVNSIGYVGEQKVPISLSMLPTGEPDKYSLSMTSQDAGYTLKALDYISTVKGGKLDLSGAYIFPTGAKGTLKVTDFYLEEQQVFTKILMLTSLTGIIDTMRGKGLFFDKAEVPFTTDTQSLSIKDAVVSGASLGITMSGKYYRQTGYLNLRGSLVPFYTLNSFLGKIPLIGRLFSGEKGGGLIAPTYTIKGKLPSPDVSVNGFSALAPGAIRSLFGAIANDDSDESLTEEKPASAPETPVYPAATPEGKEITDELTRE